MRQRASEVYRARSELLHGVVSLRDDGVRKMVREAEALARMSILCATQLYPMMLAAGDEVGPADLEKLMQRVQNDGVDWLAANAGWRRTHKSGER